MDDAWHVDGLDGMFWCCGYYRDRHGSEADVVVVRGDGVSVVEVKAGATVPADTLTAFYRVRDGLSLRDPPPDLCLVYGGDSTQKRSDLTVLSWKSAHSRPWL
jgi:hypothetical protein